MSLDNILMIPFLSKELNLIGHPELPFTLKKKCKSSKNQNTDSVNVVFDSKEMIGALVSVCFELVKQVKVLDWSNQENDTDKLRFENSKLERQLNSSKKEIEKKLDELAAEKEKNRQFIEKIKKLEGQLKESKIEQEKVMKKSAQNEDVLKHNLEKKNSDLMELHKIIWKQFNMADRNYFPENFEVVKLDQPNFSKLWSEERYSSGKNKEEVLKKAVSIFQENNNILLEDNVMLKNLLLITLREVQDVTAIMFEKMELSKNCFLENTINKVFKDIEIINIPLYKEILSKHFDVMKKIFKSLKEATFSIGDDLFICWSDVLKIGIDINE